jgi:translation initiation factor 2 beta subunit (eIF-2beta)/eIF-5
VSWDPEIRYQSIFFHETMEGSATYSYNGSDYAVSTDSDGEFIAVPFQKQTGSAIESDQDCMTVGTNTVKGTLVELIQKDDGSIVRKWLRCGDEITLTISDASGDVIKTAGVDPDVECVEDTQNGIYTVELTETLDHVTKIFTLTNDATQDIPDRIATSALNDFIFPGLLPDATEDIAYLQQWYIPAGQYYDVSSDFYELSGSQQNTVMTEINRILADTGIIDFDSIDKTIQVYADKEYPVTRIPYPSGPAITEETVSEYLKEYETNSNSESTSYILLEDFIDNGVTTETRSYIHVFKPSFDFSLNGIEFPVGDPNPLGENPTDEQIVQFYNETTKRDFAGGVYNWYYGEWNGNLSWDETRIGEPMTLEQQEFPFVSMKSMTHDYMEDVNDIMPDMTDDLDIIVKNEIEKDMWYGTETRYQDRGYDEQGNWHDDLKFFTSYVSYGEMCPSRKGGDSQSTIAIKHEDTGGSLSLITNIRNSVNINFNAGFGLVGFGGSINLGTTKTYNDFFDINGDRYPDQILFPIGSSSLSAIYNTNGGFTGLGSMPGAFPDLRSRTNITFGTGMTPGAIGSFIKQVIAANGDPEATTVDKTGFSFTPGFNMTLGQSASDTDMMDINGDGLPDHVKRTPGTNGFRVRLNLGDRFATEAEWSSTPWDRPVLATDIAGDCGTDLEVSPNYLQHDTTSSGSFSMSGVCRPTASTAA